MVKKFVASLLSADNVPCWGPVCDSYDEAANSPEAGETLVEVEHLHVRKFLGKMKEVDDFIRHSNECLEVVNLSAYDIGSSAPEYAVFFWGPSPR